MTSDSGSPRTMFVFMDESGDLQFTPKGKQHFILSAVCTTRPEKSAHAMQELKYELLSSGSDDLDFHATVNTKGTRLRVSDVIVKLDDIRVHSIWIDKAYAHPSLHDEVRLLGLFGGAMGRWVHAAMGQRCDRIIMIFDSVLTGKKQKAFVKELKLALAPLGKDVRIYFHPVKQDLNGQIADYYSWALFRALESGDPTMRDALLAGKSEWDVFNMFQRGHTRYWTREK